MRPIALSSQIDGNQGVIFMIISKHAGYEAVIDLNRLLVGLNRSLIYLKRTQIDLLTGLLLTLRGLLSSL